ncbi:MAG: replication protein [Nitrospirae bacterium]|nr:replication protein [Nitrospirota bacterium]
MELRVYYKQNKSPCLQQELLTHLRWDIKLMIGGYIMTPSRPQNQAGRSNLNLVPSSNQTRIQKGNWFIFPNDLMEALYDGDINPGMPEYERRIYDFIVRLTLGWNDRPWVAITNDEFAQGTKIDRRKVGQLLKSLICKGLIVKRGKGKGTTTYYGIQKDSSKWVNSKAAKNGLASIKAILNPDKGSSR